MIRMVNVLHHRNLNESRNDAHRLLSQRVEVDRVEALSRKELDEL